MLTSPGNCKVASLWAPVDTSNNATASGRVDTLGYNYLIACVHVDTAATTSDIPTELKLSEADVTTVASTSAIVALTGGTATSTAVGFVIPAADTSNADVFALKLDLRGRKRYIFAHYSPGVAGTTNAALALLFSGEVTPDTAAEDGSPVRTIA
jgi:hypothetical protein